MHLIAYQVLLRRCSLHDYVAVKVVQLISFTLRSFADVLILVLAAVDSPFESIDWHGANAVVSRITSNDRKHSDARILFVHRSHIS